MGLGKGDGSQGLASAYYEALERYFMSARSNQRFSAGSAAYLKASDVAAQPGLTKDLVIQRWGEEFPGSRAACAPYRGAGKAVMYPIFLSDPHYHREPLPGDSVQPYRSLLRYTSSVGTAAGVTVQEALLHGLCELIEHDGLSHAMLRWFIARVPEIDVVDPGSLPDDVMRLYRASAEAVGGKIQLLDVTTDIGVPVYLAVREGDGSNAPPFGAGASPVAQYAAARALSELIQAATVQDSDADTAAVERLAPWPALQDCMLLPVRRLLAHEPRQVALRENVGNVATVESILDTTTRLLRERDIEFYACELTPPESLVSVVAVIAPGLERFSLVHMGIPVIPTGRGWSMWAAHLHADSTAPGSARK